MSTSPKFRITVQGITAGARAGRVRQALGKKFSLTPSQVDQLLANQAGPLVGLLAHQEAWVLRNELMDLGVDCRIAPVPRSHLAGLSGKVSVQGTDPDRHVGHAPRLQRAPRHAIPMRSGKVVRPVRKPAKDKTAPPAYWRIAVVVLMVCVLGWYLQPVGHPVSQEAAAVADMVH